MLLDMEEKCAFDHKEVVALSFITASYLTILLGIVEEDCIRTYLKEVVVSSLITALYTTILLTIMEEEWILTCK